MEKLPVELLDRILHLSDLSHNARLACRSVCRGFCSALNPQAFRRIRTSEFSRDAFDRLVDLSQSPLAQFVVDYEYKLIPFLSAKDVHDVDPLMQLTSDFDSLSIQDMAEALVRHHKTHLHQVDILGTFYDIISLSKSLPAFRNLKSVTISRFDGSDQAPPSFESATTRAFWAVIKALNNCQFRIESFTIDSLYHSTLIHIRARNLGQIHEVLENLKHFSVLKLSVATSMRDIQVRTVLEEEIITQTPNLEILQIGNAESWNVDPYNTSQFSLRLERTNSPKLFHWPHLTVLEMRSRGTIRQDRLIAFLGGHERTLRELSLRGFALKAYARQISDWKAVFEKLRDLLALKRLVLSDLMTQDRRDREGKFSRVGEVQLREWEKWVPKVS